MFKRGERNKKGLMGFRSDLVLLEIYLPTIIHIFSTAMQVLWTRALVHAKRLSAWMLDKASFPSLSVSKYILDPRPSSLLLASLLYPRA